MSISENVINIKAAREYTPDKGQFVAEQYAEGQTLRALATAFPDYLPPAMYIKQWRVEWPAFDQLMTIAAAALADVKIEEAETIAGDISKPAAHAANTIKIKLAQAAALDSQVYGNKRIIAGDKDNPLKVQSVRALTDDDLMTIARGGMVIESAGHGAESESATPGTPLLSGARDSIREVRDTKIPTTTSPKDSVTTQEETVERVIIPEVARRDAIDPGF